MVACALSATITCVASAQTLAPPRIRDSAGIQIVEHTSIRNAPVAFTIDRAPSLDLGGLRDDPREEFTAGSPFVIAKRLSDGRIVATDNSALKVFAAGGKIIRILGRTGDGPGEFRQVRDVCIGRGDTIVAVGYGNGRVSVFDSAGTHVRTFTVPHFSLEDPCFDDGSILVQTGFGTNPHTRLSAERAAVLDRVTTAVRVRLDGTTTSTIGTFPGAVYGAIERNSSVVVRRDTVYSGDGRTASVEVRSSTGQLVRIVRWNDPLIEVTDRMFEERVGANMSTKNSPAQRQAMLAQARARPHLSTLPAYLSVKVDAAGRIWVQNYGLGQRRPSSWTVFEGSGRLLGGVTVPNIGGHPTSFIDLVDIGRDFAVLRWRDREHDAIHVSFHALRSAQR